MCQFYTQSLSCVPLFGGKTMTKKNLLFCAVLMCVIGFPTMAKYCVKLPSCEELGYIFPYREGRRSIRCPFDTSKVLYLDYCQAYGLKSKPDSAAGTFQECVEEKADGTKINAGYYRYIRCNSGYTYESGNCVYSCSSNKDYPLAEAAEHCKTPAGSNVFSGVTCYTSSCATCDNGYDLDSDGSCVNCQADSSGLAYGLKICSADEIGNEEKRKVTCAGKTYYEECQIPPNCFNEYREVEKSVCSSGIQQSHLEDTGEYTERCIGTGYEFLRDTRCIRAADMTPYYQIQACNIGSCSGRKECPFDEGADGETACECGGKKYFKKCKRSCDNNADYPLNTPPQYCQTATASKVINGITCYAATCRSCETGYSLDTSGQCINCKADSSGATYGYYLCGSDKVGNENKDKKSCAGSTYYKECLVKETCFNEYREVPKSQCSTGILRSYLNSSNYYTQNCYTSSGYELDKSKSCVRKNDGLTYYDTQSCSNSGASCDGKKQCVKDEGADGETACECGGEKYFKNCKETCLYKYSKDSTCTSSGIRYSYQSGNGFSSFCDNGDELDPASKSCVRDGVTYYEKVKTCTSSGATCASYKSCSYGGTDGATTCACGGNTYYSACKDFCGGYIIDSTCPYGIRNHEPSDKDCLTWSKGYEVNTSSSSCTSEGKTVYKNIRQCTASGASCAGKLRCQNPGGEICSCGGELYGEYCLTQCNYEDTEESCKRQGKGFSLRCLSDSTAYGECV